MCEATKYFTSIGVLANLKRSDFLSPTFVRREYLMGDVFKGQKFRAHPSVMRTFYGVPEYVSLMDIRFTERGEVAMFTDRDHRQLQLFFIDFMARYGAIDEKK